MNKISIENYAKVIPLITSRNEISVFSVINNIMPGKIFVNDVENPTAALIKTSECNLIAGEIDDKFISEISSELDFWDTIIPDSQAWFEQIPKLHKNKYIHPFKRRHYILSPDDYLERKETLPDGFVMEKVNLELLRNSSYKNADKILAWAADWGSDDTFYEKGVGNYIRDNKTIVSWSLSDCSYKEQITIGVNSDDNFRRRGFGIKVVSDTVKDCFKKGYKTVNWLCVDTNKGSIGIAERLGFKYANEYFFFCSFLPTENLLDIAEKDWLEWGKYLEDAYQSEPRLIEECLYSYIRANDVAKTLEIIHRMPQYGWSPDIGKYNNSICYFESKGLCSNFRNSEWMEFLSALDCRVIL